MTLRSNPALGLVETHRLLQSFPEVLFTSSGLRNEYTFLSVGVPPKLCNDCRHYFGLMTPLFSHLSDRGFCTGCPEFIQNVQYLRSCF